MEHLADIGLWLQSTIVQMIELLPFVDNGQTLIEKATSWFLAGGIGGALGTAPLYQVLAARYTVRYARRIMRHVLKWIITMVVIGLVFKFFIL